MFCSDDKHPDDLMRGHMNAIAARSVAYGHDLFDTLRAICVKPVEHYSLPVGLLRKGDPADFIMVDNLRDFNVLETWIDGTPVYKNGTVGFDRPVVDPVNNFTAYTVHPSDFIVPAWGAGISASAQSGDSSATHTDPTAEVRHVIVAHDGEIVTGGEQHALPVQDGQVLSDLTHDILKVAVVNRYTKAPVSVAFIKNFGIHNGAIASSVAHDSHNIIAVGSSDEDLSRVVNLIMAERGGIAAVSGPKEQVVGLPVAGIMSAADGEVVAKGYEALTEMAHAMGSTIHAPFMLISFMALLVIPKLKLSDKGLFDGESFSFV
jgi:adenine deaminase